MVRRLLGRACLILVAFACRSSTEVELGGEPVTGVAPSITVATLQVAGGRARSSLLVFDSTSAAYDEKTCDGGQVESCPTLVRQAGAAPRDALDAAFALTATAAFRSLRPNYGFGGGIVPPDVHAVTITVVANGRRWRVERDMRATYPEILSRLDCRLQQARGALILCTT